MSRPPSSLYALALAVLATTSAGAQGPGHEHQHAAADTAPGSRAAVAVDASMTGHDHAGGMGAAHMRLTPARPATDADRARAAEIVSELRRGLARYTDYRVAVADGFQPFLPNAPQPVVHFTSRRRAIGEAFRFDPARPSSLLYERTAGGGYKLVGAMYSAPKRLSPEKLDQRVPLGIARWHLHTDLCVPRRDEPERWAETRDGTQLFGPNGSIATREACDAVGGRFLPTLFGWMVHVHPWGTTEEEIWGGEHAGHAEHQELGASRRR